jgi:hypothetical protein
MSRLDEFSPKPAGVCLALVLAAALGACSTVGGDPGGAKPAGETSLATKLLLGDANPQPLTDPVDYELKRTCPPIEILEGTAAYQVFDVTGSTDPFALRYQASLADTARECMKLGVEAGIRVGVVGRVIVGPKGAPGTVTVPLRIAVLDEANRPLFSQVRSVQVTIPPGEGKKDFFHLEDNIVVPIPENQFRGWRIIVGYDPKGEPAPTRRRR